MACERRFSDMGYPPVRRLARRVRRASIPAPKGSGRKRRVRIGRRSSLIWRSASLACRTSSAVICSKSLVRSVSEGENARRMVISSPSRARVVRLYPRALPGESRAGARSPGSPSPMRDVESSARRASSRPSGSRQKRRKALSKMARCSGAETRVPCSAQ